MEQTVRFLIDRVMPALLNRVAETKDQDWYDGIPRDVFNKGQTHMLENVWVTKTGQSLSQAVFTAPPEERRTRALLFLEQLKKDLAYAFEISANQSSNH